VPATTSAIKSAACKRVTKTPTLQLELENEMSDNMNTIDQGTVISDADLEMTSGGGVYGRTIGAVIGAAAGALVSGPAAPVVAAAGAGVGAAVGDAIGDWF
jgi:hypothetical protein